MSLEDAFKDQPDSLQDPEEGEDSPESSQVPEQPEQSTEQQEATMEKLQRSFSEYLAEAPARMKNRSAEFEDYLQQQFAFASIERVFREKNAAGVKFEENQDNVQDPVEYWKVTADGNSYLLPQPKQEGFNETQIKEADVAFSTDEDGTPHPLPWNNGQPFAENPDKPGDEDTISRVSDEADPDSGLKEDVEEKDSGGTSAADQDGPSDISEMMVEAGEVEEGTQLGERARRLLDADASIVEDPADRLEEKISELEEKKSDTDTLEPYFINISIQKLQSLLKEIRGIENRELTEEKIKKQLDELAGKRSSLTKPQAHLVLAVLDEKEQHQLSQETKEDQDNQVEDRSPEEDIEEIKEQSDVSVQEGREEESETTTEEEVGTGRATEQANMADEKSTAEPDHESVQDGDKEEIPDRAESEPSAQGEDESEKPLEEDAEEKQQFANPAASSAEAQYNNPEAYARKEEEEPAAASQENIDAWYQNLGHKAEQLKSWAGEKVTSTLKEKTSEDSGMNRWLDAMNEHFQQSKEHSQQAREQREEAIEAGGWERFRAGFADKFKAGANFLKGASMFYSPQRWGIMGGYALETGSKAAKEARFESEELMEETRFEDAEAAAEEAWAVYEAAKEKADGDPEVTRQLLEEAYTESIPANILRRVERMRGWQSEDAELLAQPIEDVGEPIEWTASIDEQRTEALKNRLVKMFNDPAPGQNVAIGAKIAEKLAGHMQDKVEAIEQNASLSEKEKQQKKDELFDTWRGDLLEDIDKMLTEQGKIDAWAAAARSGETAGKGVVAGAMASSLVELLDSLPDLFTQEEAAEAGGEGGAAAGVEAGGGAAADTAEAAEAETTEADTTEVSTDEVMYPESQQIENLHEAHPDEASKFDWYEGENGLLRKEAGSGAYFMDWDSGRLYSFDSTEGARFKPAGVDKWVDIPTKNLPDEFRQDTDVVSAEVASTDTTEAGDALPDTTEVDSTDTSNEGIAERVTPATEDTAEASDEVADTTEADTTESPAAGATDQALLGNEMAELQESFPEIAERYNWYTTDEGFLVREGDNRIFVVDQQQGTLAGVDDSGNLGLALRGGVNTEITSDANELHDVVSDEMAEKMKNADVNEIIARTLEEGGEGTEDVMPDTAEADTTGEGGTKRVETPSEDTTTADTSPDEAPATDTTETDTAAADTTRTPEPAPEAADTAAADATGVEQPGIEEDTSADDTTDTEAGEAEASATDTTVADTTQARPPETPGPDADTPEDAGQSEGHTTPKEAASEVDAQPDTARDATTYETEQEPYGGEENEVGSGAHHTPGEEPSAAEMQEGAANQEESAIEGAAESTEVIASQAVPESQGISHAVENLQEAADVSEAQIQEAWENSTVATTDGREIPISHAHYVQEGVAVELTQTPDGPRFQLDVPEGAQVGSAKDLASVYEDKGIEIPDWLADDLDKERANPEVYGDIDATADSATVSDAPDSAEETTTELNTEAADAVSETTLTNKTIPQVPSIEVADNADFADAVMELINDPENVDNRAIFQDGGNVYAAVPQEVELPDDVNVPKERSGEFAAREMMQSFLKDNGIAFIDGAGGVSEYGVVREDGQAWVVMHTPKEDLLGGPDTFTQEVEPIMPHDRPIDELEDVTLADIPDADPKEIEGTVQGSATELKELMNTHPDMMDGTWELGEDGLIRRTVDGLDGRYLVNDSGDLIYSGDEDTPPQMLPKGADGWQEIPEDALPEQLQPYTDGAATAEDVDIPTAVRETETPAVFAEQLAAEDAVEYDHLNHFLEESLRHLHENSDAADANTEELAAIIEKIESGKAPLALVQAEDNTTILQLLDSAMPAYTESIAAGEASAQNLAVSHELVEVFNEQIDHTLQQRNAGDVEAALENL